tara:strand:- start:7411 stop:7824 length:414 start_codon:yes stop_codon:yes gene_type:complete
MIRSWIIIELNNGKTVRYVRDIVHTGDTMGDTEGDSNLEYYTYAGDSISLGGQGDTPGQIIFDFNSVLTSFSNGDSRLVFPESIGDTSVLIRSNTSAYDEPGDSESNNCNNSYVIFTRNVSDIFIQETVAPNTFVIG